MDGTKVPMQCKFEVDSSNCQTKQLPAFSRSEFLDVLITQPNSVRTLYPLTKEPKYKEIFKKLVQEKHFFVVVPKVLIRVTPYELIKEPFFRDAFMKKCMMKIVGEIQCLPKAKTLIEPVIQQLISVCDHGDTTTQVGERYFGLSFMEFMESERFDFAHDWDVIEKDWERYFQANKWEIFWMLNGDGDREIAICEAMSNPSLNEFHHQFDELYDEWEDQKTSDWWWHRAMCRQANRLVETLRSVSVPVNNCAFNSSYFSKHQLIFKTLVVRESQHHGMELFFNFKTPGENDVSFDKYDLHASACFYLPFLFQHLPASVVFHLLQFLPFSLLNFNSLGNPSIDWDYEAYNENVFSDVEIKEEDGKDEDVKEDVKEDDVEDVKEDTKDRYQERENRQTKRRGEDEDFEKDMEDDSDKNLNLDKELSSQPLDKELSSQPKVLCKKRKT